MSRAPGDSVPIQGQHVANDPPPCVDCGTPLRQIDDRPGKEAWACPIAMEAIHRGLLGKPGRKHKECMVWERKTK